MDWLGAKIKFLKMKFLVHFTIKISKLARKISRDSVPKDIASVANRVFKKLRIKTLADYVITPSKVVCSARFICQMGKKNYSSNLILVKLLFAWLELISNWMKDHQKWKKAQIFLSTTMHVMLAFWDRLIWNKTRAILCCLSISGSRYTLTF